ncbi:hypothetical protein F5Y17DRAFT_225493 [Xylariaceae sp. FL0594]|nr:hypothetical protein F5Y17DRAFT_225493 [Xylariaceae sp. FL0594]
MADVEEPKFNSLAERIAALNKQKNFTTPPVIPKTKRPPPPPPPNKQVITATTEAVVHNESLSKSPVLPARPQKREPPPLPQRTPSQLSESAVEGSPALPGRPPLPKRNASQSSQQQTPTLPPRRPTMPTRRGSSSSDISHISSISTISISRTSTTSVDPPSARRVLAPAFDQAKLPPLPPSRKEREAQAAREALEREREAVERPSLPPRLPSRPVPRSPSLAQVEEVPSPTGPRRLPPPVSSFVKPTNGVGDRFRPPPLPTTSRPARSSSPPPVPLSSRPTFEQKGTTIAHASAATGPADCLLCRDFSEPDRVAALYPSASLPRQDPVGYLAQVLCGPFPSATDKARAIFTWCHHNIAYNVEEFFGKCVKGRGVEETIFLGKAVCQGYAEVYEAIAQRAGLDCFMVTGHGKGYGFSALKRGQSPPPKDATGHAWNAVCIDNGRWKLVDACWGAGHLGEGNSYNKKFSPGMFTLSNEKFGDTHFPSQDRYFFREDGRKPTWEEYVRGSTPPGEENPQWFGDATEEGVSRFGFTPAAKHIPVNSQEVVRFQFAKVCQHWTHEKNGKGPPYLLLLKIHGLDGRSEDLVPLDSDGYWWWADIPAKDLGAPGQEVQLYALTTVNDGDARGYTKEMFYRAKGRHAIGFAIWCVWELI